MPIENADDILEHALNFGLISASKKYNIELKIVRQIVTDFATDTCTSDKCSCEKLSENGVMMIVGCLNCDKGINTRIRI
jgi:hypothetical protein